MRLRGRRRTAAHAPGALCVRGAACLSAWHVALRHLGGALSWPCLFDRQREDFGVEACHTRLYVAI